MAAAALELRVDPRAALVPVLEGGVDGAGERLIRVFLSVWDDEAARLALLGLVRGVFDPAGQQLLRDGLFDLVLGPLGPALGLDEPRRRLSLVASQLIGLVMLRYVLELESIATRCWWRRTAPPCSAISPTHFPDCHPPHWWQGAVP